MLLMREKMLMRADAMVARHGGGSLKCDRYRYVREYIYRCNGSDPDTKRGKKEAREVTLLDTKGLADDQFLDMFVTLISYTFRQM